jgi:hypothetical protein
MNTGDGNNKRYTVNVICLTIKREVKERGARLGDKSTNDKRVGMECGEKEKEREEHGGHECKYLL